MLFIIEKLPWFYTVFLKGPAGIGKFEYSLVAMKYFLEKGEKVVFISTEKNVEEITRKAEEIGVDMEKYVGKQLLFIDYFSWSLDRTGRDQSIFKIENPTNLNEISIHLDEAVNILEKPVRVIFDSVSPLFVYNEIPQILRFVQMLIAKVKTAYGFILFTIHDGVHEEQVVNSLTYFVDGLLEMKYEESSDELRRKFRVHHLRNLNFSSRWITFKTTKPQ